MRIGQGFDAHKFCQGDSIIIGGVKIEHHMALEAHSDGDVLLHAICDAILGALALGDIGKHFPDNSVEFKNIDSRILLKKVVALINDQGWKIGNLDSTIVAQVPKMSPYIEEMRQNIAADCGESVDIISVKATTTEQMGFTGRKEGIASFAIVVLIPA